MNASISDVEQLRPFDFRRPDAIEHFESGWTYTLHTGSGLHAIRHGLGGRKVYGRERVHTVTGLDGAVQVEGVEADDYPSTGALLSSLRRTDKKLARTRDEVGEEYEDFVLVEHRREIDAKWSRECLVVKLAEDDLRGWAVHAWIRARSGAQAPRRIADSGAAAMHTDDLKVELSGRHDPAAGRVHAPSALCAGRSTRDRWASHAES